MTWRAREAPSPLASARRAGSGRRLRVRGWRPRRINARPPQSLLQLRSVLAWPNIAKVAMADTYSAAKAKVQHQGNARMDDKIIVSNKAALTAKYGNAGVAKIKAAVSALVAADTKRGLRARLVYLDDAQAMKRCKGKAVTSAGDERQVKLAIDAICRALDPEYLTILGSVDVVPQQALKNVVPDDEDSAVPSDLPYACDSPTHATSPHFVRPRAWLADYRI